MRLEKLVHVVSWVWPENLNSLASCPKRPETSKFMKLWGVAIWIIEYVYFRYIRCVYSGFTRCVYSGCARCVYSRYIRCVYSGYMRRVYFQDLQAHPDCFAVILALETQILRKCAAHIDFSHVLQGCILRLYKRTETFHKKTDFSQPQVTCFQLTVVTALIIQDL